MKQKLIILIDKFAVITEDINAFFSIINRTNRKSVKNSVLNLSSIDSVSRLSSMDIGTENS